MTPTAGKNGKEPEMRESLWDCHKVKAKECELEALANFTGKLDNEKHQMSYR